MSRLLSPLFILVAIVALIGKAIVATWLVNEFGWWGVSAAFAFSGVAMFLILRYGNMVYEAYRRVMERPRTDELDIDSIVRVTQEDKDAWLVSKLLTAECLPTCKIRRRDLKIFHDSECNRRVMERSPEEEKRAD